MPAISVAIALDRFTTFGDLLRYLRRRAGLTQRELSIAVGYSDTQISRLEQNQRMPDLATLTARFLPVLSLENQPAIAERLVDLAAAIRREDAPAAGLPPYKGLCHFEEADAELFFGREALTRRILDRVFAQMQTEQRVLGIIGASGSGKSSVMRAGLIPALQWQRPSSGWPVFLMTPTAWPLEALASCLEAGDPNRLDRRRFVEELGRRPSHLGDTLSTAAEKAGTRNALLIADQFEELFTLCKNESDQHAFVDSLLEAACRPSAGAMVVVVLRADFYAHCAHFDMLRQAISQNQEFIGPMTKEELQSAIEDPARLGHWAFEPGLVDLLLHDVGATARQGPEPGALPLLSHALLATWQRRRGRTMTLSGYTATGGVRGAIAESAETVFHDHLEPHQREVARRIFLRLTELGGETSTADTRRRATIEEFATQPEDKALVHDVLVTLADARLITTDKESVEVSHEALIREWPTLRDWLEEDREGLRLHRRLTEAAQEWEALGRESSLLYRGTRLAQVSEWASRHRGDPNPLEQTFLDASEAFQANELVEKEAQRERELEATRKMAEAERSRAEEQSRASRRLRQLSVVLLIALLLTGVLAAAALFARQNTIQSNRLATSRELAAAAISNLQVDPERSTLLALEALQTHDTLEARNALHRAVPELHLIASRIAHPGGVPGVAYSTDGRQVASIGADGLVKVWDAATAGLLQTLEGAAGEPGSGIAFGPDGRLLAAAWTTQAIVWDLGDGHVVAALAGDSPGTSVGYNLGVGKLCFSPDGRRLALANIDGKPVVWDWASDRVVLTLADGLQPQKAIACAPDGASLATAGDEGEVIIWDAVSGERQQTLTLGGIIHAVAFSRDGSLLTAASEDGSVRVWETAGWKGQMILPRTSGLYDVTFLADGILATAGQDGTTRVWDPSSGQELMTLAGPTSTVISVAASPDGSRIATGAYDGSLRIWDAAPGRELLTIRDHDGVVWDVAYDPGGEQIYSASVDGFVKRREAEDGKPSLALGGEGEAAAGLNSLAVSPDGARVAGGTSGGAIVVWDSRTGKQVMILTGHSNMVVGLAFSADGTRLASASWDGTARVWDVEHGLAVSVFEGHKPGSLISGIAFSPDDAHVFTGADDKTVREWVAGTGREVASFSDNGKEIYGVAISPDGKLLAAGCQDGSITLWDLQSGRKLHTLSGHAGLVLRIAFNRDGSLLASASFDRLAKIWDVQAAEEVASLYGNRSNVFGVAFNADSTRLTTAGADGTIRTYVVNTDELQVLAQSRLTRGLTAEECQRYLHAESCPQQTGP